MCIKDPKKTSRDDTDTNDSMLRKRRLNLIKKRIDQGVYNVKSEELAEKMVQYLNENDICEIPSSGQKKIME